MQKITKAMEMVAASKIRKAQAQMEASRPYAERIRRVVGHLAHGFVMPSEALVVVTEEEVFGTRAHRKAASSKKRPKAAAFLEDLRTLAVGDFVVHADHGVGRYLGIERKAIGQSANERFRGDASLSTWLHRIVYNKAIDQLRLRAREVPLESDAEAGQLGPADIELAHRTWERPDAALSSAELRARLDVALGALTPRERAVFEMREEEGQSSEEVGRVLGRRRASQAEPHLPVDRHRRFVARDRGHEALRHADPFAALHRVAHFKRMQLRLSSV